MNVGENESYNRFRAVFLDMAGKPLARSIPSELEKQIVKHYATLKKITEEYK